MKKPLLACLLIVATFLASQFLAFYYLWATGHGWFYVGEDATGPVMLCLMGWVCTVVPMLALSGVIE